MRPDRVEFVNLCVAENFGAVDHVVVVCSESTLPQLQEKGSGVRRTLESHGSLAAFGEALDSPLGQSLLEQQKPQQKPQAQQVLVPFLRDGAVKSVSVATVDAASSRANSPARPDLVAQAAAALFASLPRTHAASAPRVLLLLVQPRPARPLLFAQALALPRLCQPFLAKSAPPAPPSTLFVDVLDHDGWIPDGHWPRAVVQNISDSINKAAFLVDAPPCIVNTNYMVEEAKRVAEEVGLAEQPLVIAGEELRDRGFGGLWNVGRAATQPPALVVLHHKPAGAEKIVAIVGKGIVYDTGGLSLKPREGMVTMKRDMGGSAACLMAFRALVKNNFPHELYALLCLAENAINERAYRPDDIITLYSGKTIEINNPDAEGRLVVGDGVAYAAKELKPNVILDMATLTGAQGIATGSKHAAIVCNDDDLETQAIRAGKKSGDLVHPLPYCPEFFRKEFSSVVADMKNSVKNRSNAQSSCAAQFIADQLPPSYENPWIHVDMAYPVESGERATGYGVALVHELFHPFTSAE